MNSHSATRSMVVALAAALWAGVTVAQSPAAAEPALQDSPAPSAAEPKQAGAAAEPEQEAAAPARADQSAAAAGPQAPEATFKSRKDRLSYAFGADIGRDLLRQKEGLNLVLLMQALTDELAGKKLLMTDKEVTSTVQTFDREQKLDLQHAAMMIGERNKREGQAFFAANAKKEGVVTLPSGLQYKILRKGDGKIPTLEEVVMCNYTGKLLNGTEIDSSYKRKQPTAMPVKDVIPGWSQALQLMPVGTKWEMYIPPQLAYGEKGTAAFGPNATLIFEVELLSIKSKPQVSDAVPAGTTSNEPVAQNREP